MLTLFVRRENGQIKITFDMSLFERLNLVGEYAFDPKVGRVLRLNRTANRLGGEQQ